MDELVLRLKNQGLLNYSKPSDLGIDELEYSHLAHFSNRQLNGSQAYLNAGILNHLWRVGKISDDDINGLAINATAYVFQSPLSFTYVFGVKDEKGELVAKQNKGSDFEIAVRDIHHLFPQVAATDSFSDLATKYSRTRNEDLLSTLYLQTREVPLRMARNKYAQVSEYYTLEEIEDVARDAHIEALLKYDATKGPLAQLISNTIRHRFLDYFRTQSFDSRAELELRELHDTLLFFGESFKGTHNRPPTESELQAHLKSLTIKDICLDDVLDVPPAKVYKVSLDVLVNDRTTGFEVQKGQQIPDPNAISPAKLAERHEMSLLIEQDIGDYSPFQREILKEYFFSQKSHGDIARDHNLTESRICQILGSVRDPDKFRRTKEYIGLSIEQIVRI